MNRYLALLFLFGLMSSSAPARAEGLDKPPTKIFLQPVHEPRPALRYRLLPPLSDCHPGNAALQYLKVPHEQTHLFGDQSFWDTIEKWAELPLDELRREVSTEGNKYAWLEGDSSGIIDFLDRGARCDSCDWGIPIREHEFYSILLPDVQSSRSSARILAARARLQIARGKYVEAIHTLQTGYALARHVALGPTLINGLVGVAIAGMMSNQLEMLVQQPGAPSLYWALATLPSPLIDFRPGYDAELASMFLSYPELRDLDKKECSPEEWRRLLQKTMADFTKYTSLQGRPFSLLPRMLEGYPRAKHYLVVHGRSAAEVEAMPAAQVMLIYMMHTYEELRDETSKWAFLPYPEARRGMERAEKELQASIAGDREIIPIAGLLLPAMHSVKDSETRSLQKIAALEVLESIRLFAADHNGALPDKLEDILEVPVPLDPFRGQPFLYNRAGDSAILKSPFPNLEPLRYEIHLAPTAEETNR